MEALQDFLKTQMDNMMLMNQQMQQMQQQITNLSSNQQTHVEHTSRVPFPKPLQIDGDIKENFDLFKTNWETYTQATGLDKWNRDQEQKKVNILLSMIGDEAKIKYNNFGLTAEDKTTVDKVLVKISDKLVAKTHAMYERWQFHTCNQLTNEPFDAYLVRLNKILDKCQFDKIKPEDFKDTMLRDRIAFGINDQDAKKKFLKEDPGTLKLDDVINICKVNEVTEDRFQQLKSEEKSVNKIIKKNVKKPPRCKFCGEMHPFKRNSCPAFEHLCKICKKKGHLEKCCFKNPKRMEKKVKLLTGEEENESNAENENSEEYDAVICRIIDNSNKGGNVKAVMNLRFSNNWKTVECILDTGANVSIIGYEFLCKALNNDKPTLLNSSYKLKSFNGTPINVLGETHLKCKHKEKLYTLSFQVVDGKHEPLLSANACNKLKLIKYCNEVINTSNSYDKKLESLRKEADRIIEEHKEVFQGYGCLPGEVELEVDTNIKPTIQPARRIPKSSQEIHSKEIEEENVQEESSSKDIPNVTPRKTEVSKEAKKKTPKKLLLDKQDTVQNKEPEARPMRIKQIPKKYEDFILNK